MEEAIFHDKPKLRVEVSSRSIRIQLLEGTLNEVFLTIDEVFEIYEQTSWKASNLKLDSLRKDKPKNNPNPLTLNAVLAGQPSPTVALSSKPRPSANSEQVQDLQAALVWQLGQLAFYAR